MGLGLGLGLGDLHVERLRQLRRFARRRRERAAGHLEVARLLLVQVVQGAHAPELVLAHLGGVRARVGVRVSVRV